jgi:hypothetical protein
MRLVDSIIHRTTEVDRLNPWSRLSSSASVGRSIFLYPCKQIVMFEPIRDVGSSQQHTELTGNPKRWHINMFRDVTEIRPALHLACLFPLPVESPLSAARLLGAKPNSFARGLTGPSLCRSEV